MGYVNIEGKDVFISDDWDKTAVFVCNKYDIYFDNEDGTKEITGSWEPRSHYDKRNKWFPYSPNDPKKIIYANARYDKKQQKCVKDKYEILHPPIYWDINGNRLPGNETQDPSVYKKEPINIYEFNYYSGGTFFTVTGVFILLAILSTIFINGGWVTWLFLIPWFIHGYRKWLKYVSLYK